MTVHQDAITHFCYLLRAEMSYDPEDIWADIQATDGYLSIGIAGDVYFWVSRAQQVFFALKYSLLERVPDRDIL